MIAYRPWAFDLKGGARVGPSQYFRGLLLATANGYPGVASSKNGRWVNVKDRYLGLKFKIDGKIHFGWARLSVQVQDYSITATLTGYAYETIPNKPITAGKTLGQEAPTILNAPERQSVTLGLLALGSHVLSIWRREESADPAR